MGQVRGYLEQLSGRMNVSDAHLIGLGLLFLSRIPRAAAATPGTPTWAWLLSQTAGRDSGIRTAVFKCLTHWLPPVDDREARAMSRVPMPPPNSESLLHALISAIESTRQVAPLLDQCLSDLSEAQADGSRYFTPVDLARLMAGAAAPGDRDRVLDPVCGSGGLLVESHRYVQERVGLSPSMSLLGKEQHVLSSQVAQMNLSLRGIVAQILPPGDSLAEPEPELHDVILANLPFNQSDWVSEDKMTDRGSRSTRTVPSDPRWPEESPSRGNANAAWIQHIAHALAPGGRAVFLMADTMATTQQGASRRLRERLLRDDLVECVIALPPRVSGPSRAAGCVWVLNKDKRARPGWGARDRRGQVLFINARRAYEQVPGSRARRLGSENTATILSSLTTWRGLAVDGAVEATYHDEPGWSRSCSIDEISSNEHSLMPTTYAAEPPGLQRDTQERIDELKRELTDQLGQMHELERRLVDVLEEL
ncbi:N-6 DNA methylase [Streptomyces sp. MAR4 CNY-716]